MRVLILVLFVFLSISCSTNNPVDEIPYQSILVYGSDFSIIKKWECI